MSSSSIRKKLREMPYVPETSYQRDLLGYCDEENKIFLMFLFCDQAIGMQVLKDAGLIRSKAQYNSCGRDMTWYSERNVPDGFRWRCQKMVVGIRC